MFCRTLNLFSFPRPKINPPRCLKCKKRTKDHCGHFEFVKERIKSHVLEDFIPVRDAKFMPQSADELRLENPNLIPELIGAK